MGCESQKATINVKINDTPSSPRIENIQFCQFTSFPDVNVQFEPGNNLRWYPSDTASVSYPSVPDFSTSTPGTYRYHVSQIDSKGCESPRKTFSITLSPTPSQLKLEDQIICQNTLTPTYKIPLDAGNEAIWYTNITDVSGSNIPPQIQTGNPGFVQYYISQRTSFGCVSLKSSIKIIAYTSNCRK
mgnify:CR=1 FL=1